MASGIVGTDDGSRKDADGAKVYMPGPPRLPSARPFAQQADVNKAPPGRPAAPPVPKVQLQQAPAPVTPIKVAPQTPERAQMPGPPQPAAAPPQESTASPAPGFQAPPQQPTAPAAQPQPATPTAPSVTLTRVPTPEEFKALGPGASAETIWGPVVADEQGNPKLVLNEAGAQAYRQARAQAVVKFGNAPLLGDPRAPQPDVQVGRPNFNPFTGAWS